MSTRVTRRSVIAAGSTLTQLGVEVVPSTAQQCAARLAGHLARWREVLESFGIRPTN